MKLLRLLTLFLPLLVALDAQAHRFAPSLLRMFEVGEGTYNVVWKTPAQATSSRRKRTITVDTSVSVLIEITIAAPACLRARSRSPIPILREITAVAAIIMPTAKETEKNWIA